MATARRLSSDLPGRTEQSRLPDSESDSDPAEEEEEEDQTPAAAPGTGPYAGSRRRSQVIHSGHFMVSSPHSDSAPRRRSGAAPGYDFDTVNRTWCHTYRFGPLSSGSLSIDPTLTRLFECMSLAYSGKIVSPKWKSFKGLRLLWRDKIRLNNAIWRAWFIQYVEKRRNPACGFVTPLEGSEADAHRKPEAIVLEGSYWKRRIEVVIKEYHKWRIYYKKRLQKNKDDLLSLLQQGPICQAKLEKWSSQMCREPESTPEEVHMFDLDCFLSNISDTLFTMTQKPYPWTGDRHNTYTSNADMIQPGLTPLQPNLDDFMDIPDIFMSYRGQPSEQTDFADCGYFEGSSSAAFGPACGPAVTTAQLLVDTRLSQPGLSSDGLSQPSSCHTPPERARPGQDGSEYHHPSKTSTSMPYGHPSYPDPPLPLAVSSIRQPAPASGPFAYPPPCHKYGYYAPTSVNVTSTVITHTASSMDPLASEPQTHGYPAAEDMYPQTLCPSLNYLTDPAPADVPSVSMAHSFSVPDPLGVVSVREKHKQKTAGVKTVGSFVARSSPPPIAPPPTSCLAKLLSFSAQERKPALGFDTALGVTKGPRPTSSKSSSDSSVHAGGPPSQPQDPGPSWPVRSPLSAPLPGWSSSLAHAGAHGGASAVCALLTRGPEHTGKTLLVPKTEKLSPVQTYGAERTASTFSFSGHSGRTSPTNPLEKLSNPESPHSFAGPGRTEPNKQTETRRITHISAEQKRRFNIKLGFDTLHNLVTTLSSQPSIKISKATTLQKTAEYIGKMQQERAQLQEETQRLREEIQLLNSAINVCQQQLPATGVPITRQRFDLMREKFREYVRAQTLQNWKFWIFSIIIEPLFESYNGMVSTTSVEDLCRSTLSWLDQHCSLLTLRPMVLSSLRLLSTSTAILTDPSLLPEQAALAVTQGYPAANPDHSAQPATQDRAHLL
ncbi:carbohydrate-responsive element-binding protein-like isoform X2 [Lampris incognitus]|uniref:carbohydrate-responsive element-binding protein-like isoform X2 n=1 Tax=Lampris incognitus TaxID=2546036 RepID=UPI0024B596A2|nr:carbohydrate-responsive element-binding protein-like isoform X2 [Lampris incognitus]